MLEKPFSILVDSLYLIILVVEDQVGNLVVVGVVVDVEADMEATTFHPLMYHQMDLDASLVLVESLALVVKEVEEVVALGVDMDHMVVKSQVVEKGGMVEMVEPVAVQD